MTVRIRREFPALGGAGHLDAFVEEFIGHFVALLGEPGTSPEEIVRRARAAGAHEAAADRRPDVLPAAVRLGAGIAIARLAEHAERLGVGVEPSTVGRFAQTAFAATDRIAEAVVAGHVRGDGSPLDQPERRRQRLLDLLLGARPTAAEIREAARRAEWRVPRRLAVIVFRQEDSVAPVFPSDALRGLHRDPPCAVVPDPDGPGRRGRLEAALRGRTAVIGPTVAAANAATSLRWADRTLDLARQGRVPHPDGRPIRASDHLTSLLTASGADLVDLVAADRLAPLTRVRSTLRHELEVTLLALFECHFRAVTVAEMLQVHPQTVRYRLRKLEALFGDDLHDPRRQLEMHLLLHARRRNRMLGEFG
ncbi:PucR family transcriptional regulator [Actinomadura rubteroloni]|uniref:PucR family transcriptional regulator n=1 Tax=Actinomadura rubteroloni TaxID=1926885 RepID=UPI0011B09C33|nr:helix-turn-helix domain-containing protein [Actinomadura rubteroloni]